MYKKREREEKVSKIKNRTVENYWSLNLQKKDTIETYPVNKISSYITEHEVYKNK